jgi:hypothetical protein
MKRKISLSLLASLLVALLALAACSKSDPEPIRETNNGNGSGNGGNGGGGNGGGGNGGNGSGSGTPIPTLVRGVYSVTLVNLDYDNGLTSRILISNLGHDYKASRVNGTIPTTIRIKNNNTEPVIDSVGGTPRAFYPNVKQALTENITPVDTLTNICLVVNNGTTRYVFVLCKWPNVIGSGDIHCPAITQNFYQINNAYITSKINGPASDGLKELQNTFQ